MVKIIPVENIENISNKVTEITELATNKQYPSAKAVYDALQDIGGGGTVDIEIDQTYNPESTNAQSGVALASVFSNKEDKPNIVQYLNYVINNDEVIIYDCDSSISGNIIIPDLIEGYPVTRIDEGAFKDSLITSITIPNSVTSIGYGAFEGCTSLTSITIPDSVTDIDSYAFYGCSSLESITLPFVGATLDGTSDTHFGYIFGAASYSDNGNYVPVFLKEVIITKATSIDGGAFYNCTSLTSITIPDSVTSIGSEAFNGCSDLTSITIPNSVTYIDGNTFVDCANLTSITIPDSVTSIGYGAFSGCSGLTSINIPNSVTDIEDDIFANCTNLTSITIPNSIIEIPAGMFYGCNSLTSITIPNSVTYIGEITFNGCTSLTSITIPDSVTSIGSEAFNGCTSLTDVYYTGTEEQWNQIDISMFGVIPDGNRNSALINATKHYNQTLATREYVVKYVASAIGEALEADY